MQFTLGMPFLAVLGKFYRNLKGLNLNFVNFVITFLGQQLYTSEVGCKRESNINKSKSNSISQALTSPPTSKIAKYTERKKNTHHLQI